MSRAVSELLEKRAALTARQAEIRSEISRIDADVAALDHVIALLDLNYQPNTSAKRPSKATGWSFGRGELANALLAVLRDAPKPLSTSDCAERIVQAKSLPAEMLAHVKTNVGVMLASFSTKGRVRRLHLNGDGRTVHWEIAR